MADKITRVQVGRNRIGLRGLEEIFQDLAARELDSPEQAQEELLNRAAARNYIPAASRAEYRRALWREFRRFRGEAVEPGEAGGLELTILGLGCAACHGFYRLVVDTLAARGLEAGVHYVTDPVLLQEFGVRALPALLINGRVALAGRVPTPAELETILAAARREGSHAP